MMEQQFTISLFQSIGDTWPQMAQRTWAQLCKKFAVPAVRQEKDGLLFSPAKYRAPRRLITNVIELSLLVLEVDGAWQCDSCGYKAPLILFRNAKHEGDRCQPCRKAKVPEPHSVSQIHFDMQMLAADVRHAFKSAFAIYSTHSHKHVTDKNPLAEPRFRIVVPLSTPVPIARFPELWETAVEALTVVPADPQVKDPNRIYYTPVKFCDEAVYEYHIEEGGPLDWQKLIQPIEQTATAPQVGMALGDVSLRGAGAVPSAVSKHEASPVSYARQSAQATTGTGSGGATSHTGAVHSSAPDYFSSHEARNEELGRRIMARGKLNSRGLCDARCLAHGGKGTSALLYNPRDGAVYCNRGCTYWEILAAEGLPDHIITTHQQLATATPPLRTSTATLPSGSNVFTPPLMTAARLHTIYALALAHCFELTAEDEDKVRKHWGDPFCEEIEWPGSDEKRRIKICSLPSPRAQLEAVKRLSEHFNLEGVPGIYRCFTELPGPEAQTRRDQANEYGPWRFYFPTRMKPGALIGPYDNNSGFILGIRIFRSVKDKVPFLLTSRGLPAGASAVGMRSDAA